MPTQTAPRTQPQAQAHAPPAPGVCPSCSQEPLTPFHRVSDVPVHSCLLMASHHQARRFPTAPLHLGLCRRCGFIANMAFDPVWRDYNPTYEETQGFSPCFNEFLVGLVRRLVNEHGLRNRTVLEIGCGKGEFLSLLCQMGDNRGIGVDPSCDVRRLPAGCPARVEIRQEYYDPAAGLLGADVVCCRHTLEHIDQAGAFVRGLRRAIGSRDVPVFFEVPDTLRVLREGAFWDLYYEHCSYFTCGSLARLFRAAGFAIEGLWLDYGQQYVMLLARPAEAAGEGTGPLEDDLQRIVRQVHAFRVQVASAVNTWGRFLQDCHRRSMRVVLWGSGSKGVAFLTTLRLTEEVSAVVDVNPFRHGKYMPGTAQRIIAPGDLPELRPDVVVVMNPIYRDEIRAMLGRMNLAPQVLCL